MDVYKEFQLKNTLDWLLIRASFLAKQSLVKVSEKYNLTLAQAFTICLLEAGKAFPIKFVATQMNCDASTATGIVDHLLELGYIERTEDTRDRRIKNIELTPSGKKIRKTLFEQISTNSSPALASLSEDEIGSLRILLTKILV
jgi:DNA-binding MarR family transcriptional regulator